jgi:uncharacterized phage protein gp47/JayE
MTTLSELLTVDTRDEVLASMVEALQEVGFPASSWHSTSVPRRLLTAIAQVFSTYTVTRALMARGGLLDYASTGWLTMLAMSQYQIERQAAQAAVGTAVAADVSSAGPWTFSAGELWFVSTGGKRFYNTEEITIAQDATLSFEIQAEEASSDYNVATDQITQLVTSVAGLGFATMTDVVATGATGLPTVTASGTPVSKYEILIEITTTGILGTALFRWSDDAGATWNATGVTVPGGGTYVLGATGITATFNAGTYTDGDTYRWNTNCTSFNPSSEWLTTSGQTEESNEDLVARAKAKWSTLGYGQNDDWWTYQALNCPVYGVEVNRVRVDTGALGTSAITITLAGTSGAIPTVSLAGIDTFLQAIKSNTTQLSVQNATPVAIDITATVNVYSTYESEALSGITSAVNSYLQSVPMGGDVYISKIIDAIQWDDDKVRDTVLTVPASDTSLTDYQVAVLGTLTLTINGV